MKRPKLSTAQDLITEAAVKASATSLIDAGSVLMVTRSGILSHSLPVAVNLVPVALNQDIKAVSPSPAADGLFLWFAFKCFERDILNECRKGGTTVHSIEFPSLLEFPIPLPPLAEQRRIVAMIEELFSELDAGEESLRRARLQLGVYRQSLLKQAFEGKLTEPWRKQNPHLLEDTNQLVNRIQFTRQASYEKQMKDWETGVREWEAGGRKCTRPIKPRRPEVVTVLPTDDLPTLPKCWIRLRFECFGDWCGGGTPSKANKSFWANGTIHWVSPKDMKSKIISSTLDLITDQAVINSTAKVISDPSVLFVVRSGILRRVLPVAMTKHPVTLNQDMQAFTPVHATTDFIYWYCQSVERDIRNVCAKDGTTVESVDVTSLKRYSSPLCSLPEQHEIVRLLDEQFTVIEQNEREIDAALTRSAALRQSILKKAFTGQLVPQDPTDEPAAALLERIRKERKNVLKTPKK
jgi:type I restriction enzyme S subunit